MGARQGSMSVLMLPWLAHGHLSPYLELAKKLAERNFFIYFCSTPINLTSIKNRLSEKYNHCIQLVELHLPSSPDLPPHYHTTNGLPSHLMSALKIAFENSSPTFTTILKTLSPDLVIYDFNQPWVPLAASQLGIPAVLFLTFGVAFTSFTLHFCQTPHVEYLFEAFCLHEYERASFGNMLEFSVNGVKDKDRVLESVKLSCNIVLIKSSSEIEGKYIDYLSVLTEKKIQPVGSLVQDPAASDLDVEVPIMQWLQNKEESSVVFVSFGSEYFLSHEEREEIAHGLELSEVEFVWVLRFPVGEEINANVALPPGFVDRVRGRGMIVEGWAPQAKILGHSSTGGFLSHCGWNSVLESIKFGVPIVAVPMHLDQPLNAKLVEEVGVGMEVKREKIGRLDRKEIARVIQKIVVENSGTEVRSKARELSEKITRKKEGEIDEVVEELVQLCGKRKLIDRCT